MQKRLIRKGMMLGILILFLGASVVSGVNTDAEKVKDINIIENINDEILTFNPTDDTRIVMYDPDNNYGGSTYLGVQNRYGHPSQPNHWEWDTLTKFDISSISPSSTIKSATLYLYYFDYYWDYNPVGQDLNLYKITSNWDEDDVTWNTQPDYDSTLTSYSTVPATWDWMAWDVTSDVQAFVDGQATNYGWQLIDENYWGGFDIPTKRFYSKENNDYIPYLEIETENGGNGFKTTFIIGKIDNLNTDEDMITFEAVNLRCLQFSPFGFIPYTSGELITISKDYMGLLTPRFIFALCGASL